MIEDPDWLKCALPSYADDYRRISFSETSFQHPDSGTRTLTNHHTHINAHLLIHRICHVQPTSDTQAVIACRITVFTDRSSHTRSLNLSNQIHRLELSQASQLTSVHFFSAITQYTHETQAVIVSLSTPSRRGLGLRPRPRHSRLLVYDYIPVDWRQGQGSSLHGSISGPGPGLGFVVRTSRHHVLLRQLHQIAEKFRYRNALIQLSYSWYVSALTDTPWKDRERRRQREETSPTPSKNISNHTVQVSTPPLSYTRFMQHQSHGSVQAVRTV
jgi:hypothetical protein